MLTPIVYNYEERLKFIKNLKYSTAGSFKEDFSNVQTIINTQKKPWAMCNFQNYYHTSQTNP